MLSLRFLINTSTLNSIIDYSIIQSKELTHNFKHFSFILLRNKILSIGVNKPNKTHPLAFKFKHRFNCTHSELDSIVRFKYSHEILQKCDMVNIRVSINDEIRIAKPCCYCFSLISAFGIKYIYYSNRYNSFSRMRI